MDRTPRRPCPACGTSCEVDQRYCRGCNGDLQRLFNQRVNYTPPVDYGLDRSLTWHMGNVGLWGGLAVCVVAVAFLAFAFMVSMEGDEVDPSFYLVPAAMFVMGVVSMLKATMKDD